MSDADRDAKDPPEPSVAAGGSEDVPLGDLRRPPIEHAPPVDPTAAAVPVAAGEPAVRPTAVAPTREARVAADMTQQDLATALKVERTVVTKAELGVRRLDPIETFEWVRCLGTTFAAFAQALEERLLALEVRNSGGGRRLKR